MGLETFSGTTFAGGTCLCPCVQAALNDIVGRNTYALRRDRVGTVEFLRSPDNLVGVQALQNIVDPGNGKKKCVTINYYTKACDSSVSSSITDDCSSGTEPAPLCTEFEVTHELESQQLVFDEDHMRLLCAPLGTVDNDWIMLQIYAQMNALLVALDKRVLALLLANVGAFMDGRTLKQVQLLNTINSDAVGPRPWALINFQHEFDEAGLYGVPNVIGGDLVNKYFKAIGLGAVNAAGLDVSKLGGEANFYFDRFVQSVFGNDEFLVMAPGVAQLVTWSRYVGPYAKKTASFEHGQIVDPFTGIPFDLKMHYNDCTDHYYIKLQLAWDVFFIPEDAEASECDMHGVSGIFNYQYCDELSECPTVTGDSSPTE
jgi:hypothetical protein